MTTELINQQRDRIAELERENESLKSSLKRSHEAADSLNERYKDLAIMKHTRFNDDECWIFDEDNLEDNHLESLVCPVVIRARTLREFFASKEKLEREKAELVALVVELPEYSPNDHKRNILIDEFKTSLDKAGITYK